jgi:hypothetical protein
VPAVYAAQRDSADAPLANPSLAFDAHGHPQYLSLADDGAHLYFEEQCYGTAGFSFLCYVTGDGGAFSLNATGPGETPSFAGPENYDYFHGFVTADAGAYYFVTRLEADGGFSSLEYGDQYLGDASLPQAVFATHQSLVGARNSFGPQPIALTSPASSMVLDNPIVSVDERTLYVSVTTASQSVPHIYAAQRDSATSSFGNFVALPELDSAEGEYPTWASPDGCRLYFTRVVNGQTDLFVASR